MLTFPLVLKNFITRARMKLPKICKCAGRLGTYLSNIIIYTCGARPRFGTKRKADVSALGPWKKRRRRITGTAEPNKRRYCFTGTSIVRLNVCRRLFSVREKRERSQRSSLYITPGGKHADRPASRVRTFLTPFRRYVLLNLHYCRTNSVFRSASE